MKTMPKYIKVLITKKDVENSKGYTSNTDCYLATALKRTKKYKNIQVYAFDVYIDEIRYTMSGSNSDKLSYIPLNNGAFKPFEVTLTKSLKPN